MKKIMEKLKNVSLKKWHILLIVIGIVFVSVSGFHSNIWFDEAYSVGMARHTFGEIWSIGGFDVHPVLYYWMLRVVYLLTGGSILAYRLFSVLPISIMIILGYTHIRKDFGEKTGFIFSFLSVFLPAMALYAVEIRMYAWAILTVTILSIYAYRLSKKDSVKDWIIFGISSLASIFLHYYGLMAAGLINVVLLIHLIRNKRKKGLIYIISFGIIQAVAYVPWLVALARQLNNISHGFWIQFSFPTTIMELVGSQLAGYMKLDIPFVLSLELYAYLIYKAFKLSKERQNIKPFLFAIGMYVAVIIVAGIMTKILGTMILYYRYLFVITGLYIFAISFILGKEKNKVAIVSILGVIAILGITNNICMIRDNYYVENAKPMQYMKENVQESDTIVYEETGSGAVAGVLFEDNDVIFYNKENWGVEEAYKAFGPNYRICTNTDFIQETSDRIWIVDDINGQLAQELYGNNSQYVKVSEEQFSTKYHDYNWKITLIERVK